MSQISNFKELKCQKSLNVDKYFLEHYLSFLITYLAFPKPTLLLLLLIYLKLIKSQYFTKIIT